MINLGQLSDMFSEIPGFCCPVDSLLFFLFYLQYLLATLIKAILFSHQTEKWTYIVFNKTRVTLLWVEI